MTEKDILDLIFALEGGVWRNWGFIITVNLAVLGWLVQRHGLYSGLEKTISTAAYTAFVIFMALGMENAYLKLDAATNELASRYIQPTEKLARISPNGIIQFYVSKSPKFCNELKKKYADIHECKKFSRNLVLPYSSLAGSWLLFVILFFIEQIWIKSRDKSEHNNRLQPDATEPRR